MPSCPRAPRALALLLLAACGPLEGPRPYDWKLPPGFTEPLVPEDNPMSEEKVTLGRFLFYDVRLSAHGTQACASCHEQRRAFADGKATPLGSTGQHVPRNSMGLANVAYFATYTWANPILTTLEQQALVPLFADAPIELGMGLREEEVLRRLREDSRYPELFRAAFPKDKEPIHRQAIIKSLASFQRALLSGRSAYDRYLQGDTAAFSSAARRGLELFFSERAECYHCHSGPHFSNSFRDHDSRPPPVEFHNTGLYNVDGQGAYPGDNTGLYEFTGRPQDMGRFRVPSLRNVALTAPYMHDGSVATLEEVMALYSAGGRHLTEGPYAGDGRANPHKDPLVRPFPLSAQERQDLVAFLESLTDYEFTQDPRFANPFEE